VAAALVSGFRALPQLVPVVVVAALSGRGEESGLLIAVVAVGLLPFSLALGVVGWWRFQYWVENGELRVEQGILVRRRVFLPRERVQAIDVSAGVIQRVFGLVRVQVKSAAAGSQAELAAVTRAEAERLRSELGHPSHARGPTTRPRRHAMTPGQVLLAASTSGQIGVILSGVAWLYTQVDDLVGRRVLEYLEQYDLGQTASGTDPLFVAGLVAAGLTIAWVLSIVGAVIRYGGFSVERQGNELVVRRGLLERKEVVIPVGRVQAVRIVESLARQPLGYAALYVESAGHAEERGKSTFLHPCLHRSSWMPLLRDVLPEFAVEPTMARPPRRALLRFLARPVLTTAIVATVVAVLVPYGWAAFALPVVEVLTGLLAYRDTGLGTASFVAVLRTRGFSRSTAIVPRRAVQFVQTSRNFFQRRRRVANVEVGAAAGASGRRFQAREMDEQTAAQFLAWCSPRSGEGHAEVPTQQT
jgi:putative membrane protein